MTWRLWPLLPCRSIPRYLEHMERDHGLRFLGLGWVPLFAKYQRIHPLHAANYDIDYFPERDPSEIQEYFDLCEASGWEPVLQHQHYKIFREQLGGAIPLYWDEEERSAVWKKARNKHLIIVFICIALLLLFLWLMFFSAMKSDEFMPSSLFYYSPRYQQLFLFFVLGSLLLAFWDLIYELIGVIFPWNNDPPTLLYGVGLITNLIIYLGLIGLVYCGLMTTLVEHREIGTFFAVLLGNCIGTVYRNYISDDAKKRRLLKGIFGPPKAVAIAFTLAVSALMIVGIASPLFLDDNTSEPAWIVSENLACETMVYDAKSPNGSESIFDLRDTHWIRSDLNRHRGTMMNVVANADLFHYLTPENLAQGIAEGRSDLNARRAHVVAAEVLLDQPEIDVVMISQVGHRYILLCEDQIYRIACTITFYDDPMLGMEEVDIPHIEETGHQIAEQILSRKEELEKMFLN